MGDVQKLTSWPCCPTDGALIFSRPFSIAHVFIGQHMPGAARGFRFRDDALLPAAPAFRLLVRQQHLETHNSLGLESLNLSLGQKLKKATFFKKLTGGWMVRTRRRW